MSLLIWHRTDTATVYPFFFEFYNTTLKQKHNYINHTPVKKTSMNNTLIWLLWASPYSFDNIIPILISFEKSVKCRTKRLTEQNKKRRTHCHKLQRFILKSRYSKFIRTGLRRLVCKCHCEERVRDRRASSRRTLNEHQNAARYMK